MRDGRDDILQGAKYRHIVTQASGRTLLAPQGASTFDT
jgi:hypothetical protein